MLDDAISKSNAREINENALKDDGAGASRILQDEFLNSNSIQKAGPDTDIRSHRLPLIPDGFPPLPILEGFPQRNLHSSDGEEKKAYIPSPSEIAPIMLPQFFAKYPSSPELTIVGEAADRLGQLMKDNASPEEQQKGWEAFEQSAKGVPGNLAALRLELSLFNDKVPGALGAEYNSYTGKLSLVDYGTYQSMGNIAYKEPDTKDLNWGAQADPETEKAALDFAKHLQDGVSSSELKQLLTPLLDKMSAAGMDSADASSTIYWALSHAPNAKYGDQADVEPSFMLDGKQVHIYTGARSFDNSLQLGFTPERKTVFA